MANASAPSGFLSSEVPPFPAMPTQLWLYQCQLERVIDGDTIVVYRDLGFHHYAQDHVRLAGLNCPEINAPDNAPGLAARQFVVDWMVEANSFMGGVVWPLMMYSTKLDKYGRSLAVIWRRSDGQCLNQALLDAGQAVVMLPSMQAEQV